MEGRPICDYFGIALALGGDGALKNIMRPSLQDRNDVVERSRLLCDEAKQLCSEIQEALAKMQQLRWQLRESSRSGDLAVGRLAGKCLSFSSTNVMVGTLVY